MRGRESSIFGGVLDPDKGGVGEVGMITGTESPKAEEAGGANCCDTGSSFVVSMTIVDPYFPNFPE